MIKPNKGWAEENDIATDPGDANVNMSKPVPLLFFAAESECDAAMQTLSHHVDKGHFLWCSLSGTLDWKECPTCKCRFEDFLQKAVTERDAYANRVSELEESLSEVIHWDSNTYPMPKYVVDRLRQLLNKGSG